MTTTRLGRSVPHARSNVPSSRATRMLVALLRPLAGERDLSATAHHFSQNHWRLGSQHFAVTTSVSGSDIAASHPLYICTGMRLCFHIVFIGSRTSSFVAWIRVGSHIPGGYDLCASLVCARVFSLCRRMHGAPARLFAHELRIGPFVPHRLVLLPSRLSIRTVLSHPSAVSIRETSGCLMPLLCMFEFISLRLVCGFWRWLITTPSVTSQLGRFRLHFSLGGYFLSINGSLPRFTMRAHLFRYVVSVGQRLV